MSDMIETDDEEDEIDSKTVEMERVAVSALRDAGLSDFEKSGSDNYDNSLELYRVGDDVRLTPEQQKAIYDAGFFDRLRQSP